MPLRNIGSETRNPTKTHIGDYSRAINESKSGAAVSDNRSFSRSNWAEPNTGKNAKNN